MKNYSIAVMDSGIGGISVLSKLVKIFPNEHFIYFGDNDNAPYGNLSNHNLLKLVIRNLDFIKQYKVKAIVLACNTLSVNLYFEIKEYSGLPVFCVIPPVEWCQINAGKTLLLATEKTAKKYSNSTIFDSVGLKDLAWLIEKNIFNIDTFDFKKYCSNVLKINVKKGYYRNVILGCTHYNFLKKQISIHFRPQNIYDGTENLIKQLKLFLSIQKTLEKNKAFDVLFVGKNAKFNNQIYNVCGQNLLN